MAATGGTAQSSKALPRLATRAGRVANGAGRSAKRLRDRGEPMLARMRPMLAPVTNAGWAVLAFGVAAWFAGWYFGWNELMIVAAACALIVTAGAVFTIGRTSLVVTLAVDPQRVTVGEPALGRVDVVNKGRRQVVAAQLEVPVGVDGRARLDPPALGGGATFTESFLIPTSRRSVVRIGPARSIRGDPLGLVQRVVDSSDSIELFVHPRITVLPAPAAGWMRDLEGMTTNDLSPSDVAFHTLREYVPGDEPRNIHWRTSARRGKLMVRQFVDTRRAHVGIVLSVRSDDYVSEHEFELAVSVAGSLGASALASEQNVTCLAGRRLLPTHSRHGLLDALAGVELDNKADDLASSVRRGRRQLQAVSVGVVLTGTGVTTHQLRSAASWLPPSVRVLAIRAEPAGESSIRVIGNTQLATIGTLDDLGPRLAALARR